jgi:DNA-binding MarR family transcriptional regulator
MGSHTSDRLEVQAILDGVRHIVQALRESSRLAEQHVGMTAAQLFVLQTLSDTAAMSVNELATRTHTHQSSVSAVVARLVDKRLIRRDRSTTDGRSVRLSLTARGREIIGRAPDMPQERLVRGIEKLSATRRRQLSSGLRALAEAVAAADRAPAMFFEDPRARNARGGKARA